MITKDATSVYIALILIFLSGCFHENTNDSKLTVLEGTWKNTCFYNSNANQYGTVTETYEGNVVTGLVNTFSDALCSIPIFSMERTAVFSIGENKVVLTTGDSVNEITLTYSKWVVIPETEQVATAYNDSLLCDMSNWITGEKSEVLGCIELGVTEVRYGIFKIEGNNLYFGDAKYGDGTSVELRPTQLNSFFYTKQ